MLANDREKYDFLMNALTNGYDFFKFEPFLTINHIKFFKKAITKKLDLSFLLEQNTLISPYKCDLFELLLDEFNDFSILFNPKLKDNATPLAIKLFKEKSQYLEILIDKGLNENQMQVILSALKERRIEESFILNIADSKLDFRLIELLLDAKLKGLNIVKFTKIEPDYHKVKVLLDLIDMKCYHKAFPKFKIETLKLVASTPEKQKECLKILNDYNTLPVFQLECILCLICHKKDHSLFLHKDLCEYTTDIIMHAILYNLDIQKLIEVKNDKYRLKHMYNELLFNKYTR